MYWEKFWNDFPTRFAEDEFLRQVSKTFKGQPVSEHQLNLLISELIQILELRPTDSVLDICCGNGLITSAVSEKCAHITGVDFSERLIQIAKNYFGKANTSYFKMSVLDINHDNLNSSQLFDKIYMYEALQHFKEEQFPLLLERVLDIASNNCIIYIGSIPDFDKLWSFYDTPEKQAEYLRAKDEGQELLGTWWSKVYLEKICSTYNLGCNFIEQSTKLHTSYYRFDMLINRI